jgi:hypothetical protein
MSGKRGRHTARHGTRPRCRAPLPGLARNGRPEGAPPPLRPSPPHATEAIRTRPLAPRHNQTPPGHHHPARDHFASSFATALHLSPLRAPASSSSSSSSPGPRLSPPALTVDPSQVRPSLSLSRRLAGRGCSAGAVSVQLARRSAPAGCGTR